MATHEQEIKVIVEVLRLVIRESSNEPFAMKAMRLLDSLDRDDGPAKPTKCAHDYFSTNDSPMTPGCTVTVYVCRKCGRVGRRAPNPYKIEWWPDAQ